MIKIGNIELENNIFAAPLAGYTNIAYRNFLKEFDTSLVVSEMISDCALMYKNKDTLKMINVNGEKRPIALQLFGGSKKTLIEGAKILVDKVDFDILDINLGCPVNKVVKSNAGSAWLKKGREEELFDMMSSLVKEINKPITAKIRLGWDHQSINCVEIAKILEKAGVKMIVIHGRTRSDLYAGTCNYDYIKQVKEAVSIPVIANGDIDSIYKAKEVLDYTHADGLMIGRGSLGNPFIFNQINTYLKDGTILDDSPLEKQIEYVCRHYEMLKEEKGEFVATKEMRNIAPRYLKGYDNTKEYRLDFTRISNSDDFYKIIKKINEKIK